MQPDLAKIEKLVRQILVELGEERSPSSRTATEPGWAR
jgi:hypothetical protein